MNTLALLKTKLGKWLAAIGVALATLFAVFFAGKRRAHHQHKADSAELRADTLEELREVEKQHAKQDHEAQDSVAAGDRDHLDSSW